MTWNYRIVKHTDKESGLVWYSLHEVYYDETGKPVRMTSEPVGPSCDEEEGPAGIVNSIRMMLADVEKHSVFVEPESWGKDEDE